jgi:hypothetical protein
MVVRFYVERRGLRRDFFLLRVLYCAVMYIEWPETILIDRASIIDKY